MGPLAVVCLAAAVLSACAPASMPSIPLPGAPAGPRFTPFTFLQAGDPQIGGWTSIEDTKGRFAVMHHPPATLPLATARLDSLFRQYDVRVVLAGHIHRTEEVSYRGYTTFTVAGTGWASDRKGFGYRAFHVYADRVEQEYVRLDAATSQETRPQTQTRSASTPAAP